MRWCGRRGFLGCGWEGGCEGAGEAEAEGEEEWARGQHGWEGKSKGVGASTALGTDGIFRLGGKV